jgi:hypothetical protein
MIHSITSNMKIIRQVILGVGIAAILFELVFPPLRSPTPYYAEPQLVGQQFVAVHISRFSTWRPDLARLEHGAVVRTEIDGGELLRELAFLAVLFGAAYLWAPAFVHQARSARSEFGQEGSDSTRDA